ncbi:MAG: hypothetical protein ABGW69_04000 [Nanoarchaeota archaeon]
MNSLVFLGHINDKNKIEIRPSLVPCYNSVTIFPDLNFKEAYVSNFESNKLISYRLTKNRKENLLIKYKGILESLEYLMDRFILTIPKFEIIKNSEINKKIKLIIDTKFSYFTPLVTLKFDHLFRLTLIT